MSPRLLSRNELALRNETAERLARRDAALGHALTALQCVLCAAVGIGCIGLALHTTTPWIGRTFFWLGVAIGNAGILFTLLAAYRRAERRGDF